MSENVISVDLIADIFNIPVDGKNINDEDDVDIGESKSTIPFTEKVKEIEDQIATVASTPIVDQITVSSTPIVKTVVQEKVAFKVEVKSIKVESPQNGVEAVLVKAAGITPPSPKIADIFDDAPEPVKVEVKVETPVAPKKVNKEAIKQAIETAAVEYEVEEDEKKKYDAVKDESRCNQWADGENWLLKSPGPKYNKFYEEKSIALSDGPHGILVGGSLDFNQIFDDLASVTCDMTVSTYDSEAIYDKMIQIQKMRERVCEIQLKVSRQYFLWDRYIDLLRGVLCRTEYERGKQEGLNYEHLRDMEHYFCSLKTLQKGTETIVKTLDSAFDVLSRQVTIVMPMKEVDRTLPNSNMPATPKPMSPALRQFDSLRSKTDNKPSDGSSSKGTGWNL